MVTALAALVTARATRRKHQYIPHSGETVNACCSRKLTLFADSRRACRDAIRHVQHLDLHDNGALAHDLEGKHNDIKVQIRSKPKGGRMTAPPLVRLILQSMGVGSASANTIGRQNPYAVVRATFNALNKHTDLVEYSKATGKRYVTLKWLYDNNVGSA
jgi:ribosomal protein S5